MTLSRRHFLAGAVASACGVLSMPWVNAAEPKRSTQPKPEGFFTLGQRGERWWFLTPKKEPFFSLGLNHIDSSTLRYPENEHVWKEKYGNDQLKWIRDSVAPNL